MSMFDRQNTQVSENTTRISMMILFALFVLALLCALVVGIRAYGAIFSNQNSANVNRFSFGLLENSIKSADSYASIRFGEGPEGNSLVLLEFVPSGEYETRIYQYQGGIYQESTLASNEYNPQSATKIMDSQIFDISLDGSLLSVTTDGGTAVVTLHSSVDGVW